VEEFIVSEYKVDALRAIVSILPELYISVVFITTTLIRSIKESNTNAPGGPVRPVGPISPVGPPLGPVCPIPPNGPVYPV